MEETEKSSVYSSARFGCGPAVFFFYGLAL